jgi:hypothetical protein
VEGEEAVFGGKTSIKDIKFIRSKKIKINSSLLFRFYFINSKWLYIKSTKLRALLRRTVTTGFDPSAIIRYAYHCWATQLKINHHWCINKNVLFRRETVTPAAFRLNLKYNYFYLCHSYISPPCVE